MSSPVQHAQARPRPVSQATCPHCRIPTASDERIKHTPTQHTGKRCECSHPEHRHAPNGKCWAIEDDCSCVEFREAK